MVVVAQIHRIFLKKYGAPTRQHTLSVKSVLGRDSKKDSERKLYLAKEKPDISYPWTVNFSCLKF